MCQSLSYSLLMALRKGASRLTDEARQRVCHFICSQRTENETFVNRSGHPDLYYTMFGWMLCYALGIHTNSQRRRTFLNSVSLQQLDETHRIVFCLCQKMHLLLSMPALISNIALRYSFSDQPFKSFLTSYNHHGSGNSTNAWASQLVLSSETNKRLTDKLLSMQHDSGGFKAHEHSVMPDLLSTAVASFALCSHEISPKIDMHSFIEAHWLENGGFVATLLDERSDVEYMFYGLLALGCL